jgi:heptosyltransferase-2
MDKVNAPQRLVIRAPNWLGDAVMALPALAAVRAALPDTHITIAAIASVAPLFHEETPAAPDDVLTIPDRSREAKTLRDGRFDAGLLLTNSFRSAWALRRAGIAARWGFATNARGFLLTRRVPRPRPPVHQSVYYSALVEALGFVVTDTLPRIGLRPETVARASETLTKFGILQSAVLVAFAPGAAYGHAKRWPPSRVAAVVRRLAEERGAISILVGAGADRDAGREIESALAAPVRVVNLIGRTDLRQVAGILARCAALVSNDSGAMHVAAAVGVPVTAIFGPTDERVTAPLGNHDVIVREVFCRPCMLRDCPIDHRCMKRIPSDAVFDAVAARLVAGGAAFAEATARSRPGAADIAPRRGEAPREQG